MVQLLFRLPLRCINLEAKSQLPKTSLFLTIKIAIIYSLLSSYLFLLLSAFHASILIVLRNTNIRSKTFYKRQEASEWVTTDTEKSRGNWYCEKQSLWVSRRNLCRKEIEEGRKKEYVTWVPDFLVPNSIPNKVYCIFLLCMSMTLPVPSLYLYPPF